MKKIITLLSISLLIVNCEEGGGGGSQPSTGADCKLCGDYIPNNKADLGDIAQHMIDNDQWFDDWFNSVNAGNGEKTYADSQIVSGIRGFLSAKAKEVDGNGALNVLATTPMAAYMEAVDNPQGFSQGLDRQGLCYMGADIYASFRITANVVNVSGANHSLAPGGSYCALELDLPNGKILIDVFLNRSFYSTTAQFLSLAEVVEMQEEGRLAFISTSPDGMANAMPGWDNLGGYYHTYEDISEPGQSRDEVVRELQDLTFDSITVVDYDTLR